MKAKLVYWKQNGRVLREEIPYAVISELIAGTEPSGKWVEGVSEFGYWRCELYIMEDSVFMLREWVPAIGHVWHEIEIWQLEF